MAGSIIEVELNVGGTGGWKMTITAGVGEHAHGGAGAQPTFASDVGELDISFHTTDVAGEVRIHAQHSIQATRGAGSGETVDFNLVVNGNVGTVRGTIVGKGMGKGR
jgi:hypothetical protein